MGTQVLSDPMSEITHLSGYPDRKGRDANLDSLDMRTIDQHPPNSSWCCAPKEWGFVTSGWGKRFSSVVEHSSGNPKVRGSIPGPVLYRDHGL